MFSQAAKVWHTARVLSRVPLQRRIPHLSPARLCRLQDVRVCRLVAYAAKHVPYYVELFRKHRLDSRSIRSAADLQSLPLLDKDVFRTNSPRFIAGCGVDNRLFKLRTSGSTGSPVEIYHDVRSLLMNLANVEPEKAVLRQVLSQASINRTKRQMSIAYPGSSARAIRQMYANKLCIRPGRTEPFVSIDTPLDEVVRQINAYEPDVISSYGSYVEMLFRHVAANNIEFRQPEVVLYGADMMTPEGNDLIERQFGVTVLSRYGAVEAFHIGFTCPAKRGFHVRSDLNHIRIVDERGKDVPPDTPGEIVITNLVNRGSILINYRMGDVGVFSSETCPCGRTLPLLKELLGRQEDILLLSGGRRVHPREVWAALKSSPDIIRYQLVQDTLHQFRLRLATPDQSSYARILKDPLLALRQTLGNAEVVPEYCPEIVNVSGKFRPVVSNLHAAAQSAH